MAKADFKQHDLAVVRLRARFPTHGKLPAQKFSFSVAFGGLQWPLVAFGHTRVMD